MGELEWKWSVKPFCRLLCPGGFGVDDEYTYTERKYIMLEWPNCTKIEAELLTCGCDTRPGEGKSHMFSWYSLISGLNGEIYRMQVPFEKTKCDDEKTYTISDVIVRGRHTRGRHLPLWGVGKVFEVVAQKGFDGRKRRQSGVLHVRK